MDTISYFLISKHVAKASVLKERHTVPSTASVKTKAAEGTHSSEVIN